jgi:hypothetical protein
VFRLGLVAMFIDPKIVFTEPFLEPISLLGTGALLRTRVLLRRTHL